MKSSNSVCGIVVAYFPGDDFDERIQSLLPQVTQVVVVDNTPAEHRNTPVKKNVLNGAQLHVIENQDNLGIAEAINQGLRYALSKGYTWILTLDQDTKCFPDMVDTLLEVSKNSAFMPMVIGGNYYDPQIGRTKVPPGKTGAFLEQKTVITSGCLINSKVAAAIGGFRADYFIDQVDHEFCLRARANGHTVAISRKPVMVHSVGLSGGVKVPFLGVLPSHPPLRKYYIARNTIVTVADYWRREPGWCLRRLARLIFGLGEMALLEKDRFRKVRAFSKGAMDGLNRRLGRCPEETIGHCRTNSPSVPLAHKSSKKT